MNLFTPYAECIFMMCRRIDLPPISIIDFVADAFPQKFGFQGRDKDNCVGDGSQLSFISRQRRVIPRLTPTKFSEGHVASAKICLNKIFLRYRTPGDLSVTGCARQRVKQNPKRQKHAACGIENNLTSVSRASSRRNKFRVEHDADYATQKIEQNADVFGAFATQEWLHIPQGELFLTSFMP